MRRGSGSGRRRAKPTRRASRAVVIHSLDHARAALGLAAELGVPVTLLSAPGAAAYAGAGWFVAVIAAAAAEFPAASFRAVLDCGDAAGYALAALRAGCRAVRLDCPPRVRRKVAAIAEQYGAGLYDEKEPALDLFGCDDPVTACREWLGGSSS